MVMTQASIDDVWAWLDQVPDPEIPAISLVDLGVIRNIAWQGDTLEVTITPTYSGCPATSIINFEIEAAFARSWHRKSVSKKANSAPLDDRLAVRCGPDQA